MARPSVPKDEFYFPFKQTRENDVLPKELDSVMISFHDHPFYVPQDSEQWEDYWKTGRPLVAYDEISAAGLSAVFADFHYCCRIYGKDPEFGRVWDIRDLVHSLGMLHTDMLKQKRGTFFMGGSSKDIIGAFDSGRVAIIPTTESIGGIGDDLDQLDVLYGLGLRVAGLTYANQNHIGGGQFDPGAGLTEFGKEVVHRLNDLGIMVDLSHNNKKTTLEVLDFSEEPCVMSHALVGELTGRPDDKTDEEIAALAREGGLFAVKVSHPIDLKKGKEAFTVEDSLDHIEYVIELVGAEHVAIGPDSFVWDSEKGVKGIKNSTQFINVVRGLAARGHSYDEIRKIMGENVVDVMRAVES